MSDFATVATIDELKPGDPPIVVEIMQRWVAIFNIDGEYYAIEDVCTHDDGPLAEGNVNGCVIECPRHGAKFDLRTGEALSAPAFVNAPTYEVRIQGDDIQIGQRVKK